MSPPRIQRTMTRQRKTTRRKAAPAYAITSTAQKTHLTIQIQDGPFQQVTIRLGDIKFVKGCVLNVGYRIQRLPKSYPNTIEVVRQTIRPTLKRIVYNMVVNAVAKAEQVIAKSTRAI